MPKLPEMTAAAIKSREALTKIYKASDRYVVADTITHPTFGTGVIQRVHDTAVDVLFETGLRTLVHAKGAASGLEKPKPFDHRKGPTRV